MISVIIPVYNEELVLSKAGADLEKLSHKAELIFADGKSTDRSVEIAQQYGRVFHSDKGRASQMNYGAGHAQGDILLFLHADNMIFTDTLLSIETKIYRDGFIGGCLTQRIDNPALVYRFIEAQGNFRAHLTKEFYGDQGIFVKKDIFLKIGGFPEVPIMEDVIFTKQLSKCGRTIVLSDRIIVSARRWQKKGVIKTTFLFNLIILLFWLKVPLHKIKQFYEDLR